MSIGAGNGGYPGGGGRDHAAPTVEVLVDVLDAGAVHREGGAFASAQWQVHTPPRL